MKMDVVLTTLLTVVALARCAAEPPATPFDAPDRRPAARQSQIVLLGTGTPNANPGRAGSAVAIVVGDTPFVVDCGPGVVRRAVAAYLQGIVALEPTNLRHLLVTHLHSDHTLGLPDFMLTPWVLGRETPVEAFGPPGLAAMTDHLLEAYEQDIRIRADGLEKAPPNGYKVNVCEIAPGVVYEDARVRIKAFEVCHGSWEHAFGYRFETPERVIVISGDTGPCESLIENARGCDVLIHEVYCTTTFARRPPNWQRYHRKFHTSSVELAAIANQVRPKLLILYHQLLWGGTDEMILHEIRRSYSGAVVSGRDLEVY